MPGVRPLDHPAPWLSSDAPDQRLLASTTDVWRDAPRSDGGLHVCIVVAFVEAEVLGTPWTARAAQDNCVKRLSHEPLVVNVRAGDLGRKRHASTVGQNVTLDPSFGAICRARTRQVPPLGALTIALSSEAHLH